MPAQPMVVLHRRVAPNAPIPQHFNGLVAPIIYGGEFFCAARERGPPWSTIGRLMAGLAPQQGTVENAPFEPTPRKAALIDSALLMTVPRPQNQQ
jgi:hypothetical protein